MQLVTNYLKKSLVTNFLLVLLFFTVIAAAMEFVSQMKSLGEGSYNFVNALSYVLLLLPRNIYKLSPIILAVSVAYTAFKFINTKELTAMGAVGLTTKAALHSLSKLAVLIILLFFMLGEGLGPWCANLAKNNRINAIAGGKAFAASSGIWLHEDNWYINIANVIDNKHFENITKYLVVAGALERIEHAKHGQYENNSWLLTDIVWQDFRDNKIVSGQVAELAWQSALDSSIVDTFNIMPMRQTLWDLGYVLNADLDIGTNVSKYIFWQRLFYPVSLFFMLYFVAAVFFNSAGYNKSKSSFIVASFVLFYYFAPDYLLSFSFYNISPIIAALLLPAATAGIFYVFMRKNMLD